MKTFVSLSLFIFTLLLAAGPATAKTFYLKDGSTIEYRKVWKEGGLIHLLVNRDTLVTFLPEEVDQRRTLKAAGLKKFPQLAAKRQKAVAAPVRAKRTKAAPALSPAPEPAPEEKQPPAYSESRESGSGTTAPDRATTGSSVPAEATVNDKYSDLVQVMNCSRDRQTYGEFRDYGWWGGGPWCGQTGKAGYWVWVAPNWYVWAGRK